MPSAYVDSNSANCSQEHAPRKMALPTTADEAIAWMHSHTATNRLALAELKAAFDRLAAETGFALAKAAPANG
jgi:hypothetical protein